MPGAKLGVDSVYSWELVLVAGSVQVVGCRLRILENKNVWKAVQQHMQSDVKHKQRTFFAGAQEACGR